MLNKIKNRKQEGFTIIEVLIVLAIAGLILLVVFLAVPALQRNSRNTSIKNDVQNVLGGVSEYQNVNSGAMPTGISGTGTVNYTGGTATSIKIQGTTQVTKGNGDPGNVAAGDIVVVVGQHCSTAKGGNGQASARAISAYYSLETTSGTAQQCQDS